MPGAANPEAIAWYVQRSEALLDDLRERVQSLRTRGGQLAGFSGAVLALAGANVSSIVGSLHGIGRDGGGACLLIGVLLLTASLVTALGGTLAPRLVSDISAREVSNFASERFTHEPELWRVHVRTLGAVLDAIERTSVQGDEVAWAVRKAEYLFLAGLFSVAIALGNLIVVMTF
jgi:hypothetical protein